MYHDNITIMRVKTCCNESTTGADASVRCQSFIIMKAPRVLMGIEMPKLHNISSYIT